METGQNALFYHAMPAPITGVTPELPKVNETQVIGADYAALYGYDHPLGAPLTRIRHAVLVFLFVFLGTLAYVLLSTGFATLSTTDPTASTLLMALAVGVGSTLTVFFLGYTFGPVDGFHANWWISFNVYLGFIFNRHNNGWTWKVMLGKFILGGIYFIFYILLQIVAALSASFFLQQLLGGNVGALGFPAPSVSSGNIALINWFGSTLIGMVYMYGMFVYKTPNTFWAYGAAVGAVSMFAFPFTGLAFNPMLYFGPAIAIGSVSNASAYVLASWLGYLTALLVFEIDRNLLRMRPVYVGWAPFTYKTWTKYSEMKTVVKKSGD